MPFLATSVMEARIEFVIRAQQAEQPFSRLCAEYGISRPTGYLWLQRYREAGSVTALQEHSRRPHASPNQTSKSLVSKVATLRQRYSWGARKLRVLLQREGITLSEATINRILARQGLLEGIRPQPAIQRFARLECNQLLQMDFKGEYPIKEGRCYPLSLLDDHSRYLLGLWPLTNPNGEAVKSVLERLFYQQGVPQAMLLDHGTPWWSTSNGHGLTRLSVWLMKQDLQLHFGRIRHPQTQGKVERMHRSLKARTQHAGLPETLIGWRSWAKQFRAEYNEIRPHEALAMATPAEIYQPVNLHPYQAHPREWDYGEAEVARLNSCGCLYYRGRQYFVCEALANERVQLEELDHLLIVTFRTTTVREINLRTSESRPVVFSNRIH